MTDTWVRPRPNRDEPLTMQRYFTETIDYLRQQPERCLDQPGDLGICAYRSHDEVNACAVGYWIPDDSSARHASGDARDFFDEYPELIGVAVPDDDLGIDLACDLQLLHDDNRYRVEGPEPDHAGSLDDTGEEMAERVAERFGLTYTPPEATS